MPAHASTPDAPDLSHLTAQAALRALQTYVQACAASAKQADQQQMSRARHQWLTQARGIHRWGPAVCIKSWIAVTTVMSAAGLSLAIWAWSGGMPLQRGQLGWIVVSLGISLPLGIWVWIVQARLCPPQHALAHQDLLAVKRLASPGEQPLRAAEACQRLAPTLAAVHGRDLRRQALQCLGERWAKQLGPFVQQVGTEASQAELQALRQAAKSWAPMAVQHVLAPWWGVLSRQAASQFLAHDWSAITWAEANLCASSLAGLRAQGADLYAASLQGVNWAGAQLPWARLNYAFLQLANFDATDLREANFEGADASGASFIKAQLTQVSATGLRAILSDFSYAQADGLRLRHGQLQHSRWAHAHLNHADWSDTDARHVDLSGASLCGARLQRCDLRGAQLAGVRWDSETDFRGVRLDRHTRWQAGSQGMNPPQAQAHLRTWLDQGAVWIDDESDPLGLLQREASALT